MFLFCVRSFNGRIKHGLQLDKQNWTRGNRLLLCDHCCESPPISQHFFFSKKISIYHCGGLNMKSLEAHVFGSLTTNWWNNLGRIRRWDIVGGDVSLGPSLEASKHLGHSQSLLVSLPSSCRRTCKLSAAPTAMHLLCHHGLQPF